MHDEEVLGVEDRSFERLGLPVNETDAHEVGQNVAERDSLGGLLDVEEGNCCVLLGFEELGETDCVLKKEEIEDCEGLCEDDKESKSLRDFKFVGVKVLVKLGENDEVWLALPLAERQKEGGIDSEKVEIMVLLEVNETEGDALLERDSI